MSSEFVNLLHEITPELPGGDEHVYSRQLRESLIGLRKPELPDGDGDTGYRRNPDWEAIVDISTTALTEQTKDLRIVCHLAEAWTQIRGFDGLADGLEFLTEFITTCWERCNPPLDDGDLEVRTAPLENMLDDPNRGICFPTTVRQIPLLGSGELKGDYLTCHQLQQSTDEEERLQFEKMIISTDPEQFSERLENIARSSNALRQLKSCMDEKIGNAAPALTYLGAAIADCERLASLVQSRILVVSEGPTETGTEGSTVDSETGSITATQEVAHQHNQNILNSRDAAYRQLKQAAEFLQKTEPHSPIPYLVYRAVSLGQLPFPDLVQQLVREEGILNELRREFGIKQQPD